MIACCFLYRLIVFIVTLHQNLRFPRSAETHGFQSVPVPEVIQSSSSSAPSHSLSLIHGIPTPPAIPSHKINPSSGSVSGVVTCTLISWIFSHGRSSEQTSRAIASPFAPLERPEKFSKVRSLMLTLENFVSQAPHTSWVGKGGSNNVRLGEGGGRVAYWLGYCAHTSLSMLK